MNLKISLLVVLLIGLVSLIQAKRGKDFVEAGEVKPGKIYYTINVNFLSNKNCTDPSKE